MTEQSTSSNAPIIQIGSLPKSSFRSNRSRHSGLLQFHTTEADAQVFRTAPNAILKVKLG